MCRVRERRGRKNEGKKGTRSFSGQRLCLYPRHGRAVLQPFTRIFIYRSSEPPNPGCRPLEPRVVALVVGGAAFRNFQDFSRVVAPALLVPLRPCTVDPSSRTRRRRNDRHVVRVGRVFWGDKKTPATDVQNSEG